MHAYAVLVALALILVPLGAGAADLVVWWEKGVQAEEDEAVTEIIAAFEQDSGKHTDVSFYPREELAKKIEAALEAGGPPDFAFGYWLVTYIPQWALDDRLVDLTDTVGHFADMFDSDQLDRAVLLNAKTARKALCGVPMGTHGNYIHVWKSLLERAGLSLEDVPKQWRPFWSFWCDQVQPAVRKALGVMTSGASACPMSVESNETADEFFQFVHA